MLTFIGSSRNRVVKLLFPDVNVLVRKRERTRKNGVTLPEGKV
jgi:hypothetical protein